MFAVAHSVYALKPRRYNRYLPGTFPNVFSWKQSFIFLPQITLNLVPDDLIYDKPEIVHVMIGAAQTTSIYLKQCWQSSMTPYGVTRPQWNIQRNDNTITMVECWYVCSYQLRPPEGDFGQHKQNKTKQHQPINSEVIPVACTKPWADVLIPTGN